MSSYSRTLNSTAQTFKPSRLCSMTIFDVPLPPVEHTAGHTSKVTRRPSSQQSLLVHLPKTLPWMWQCHVCHRSYRLTTTRRCLDDGHRFCAGTTTVKRNRKTGNIVVRHKACTSEFDYAGWKRYVEWRRSLQGTLSSTKDIEFQIEGSHKLLHNCWTDCGFPSECRWGAQVGIEMCQPTEKELGTDFVNAPLSLEKSPEDADDHIDQLGEPGTLGSIPHCNQEAASPIDGVRVADRVGEETFDTSEPNTRQASQGQSSIFSQLLSPAKS